MGVLCCPRWLQHQKLSLPCMWASVSFHKMPEQTINILTHEKSLLLTPAQTVYHHQEVAQPPQPPFKRLPWPHFPHIQCLMGHLTVSSLNFKLLLIAYADDQAVANVGCGARHAGLAMSMVLRRAASLHAEGSPTSPGWPGHRAALQHLQGPCSKSFPGAGQSHPAVLPALATMGAHRGASCPPISPAGGQRCCSKSHAAPFPQGGKAQSHTEILWAPLLQVGYSHWNSHCNSLCNSQCDFQCNSQNISQFNFHCDRNSLCSSQCTSHCDSYCNSQCIFHSYSHCDSSCISQCTSHCDSFCNAQQDPRAGPAGPSLSMGFISRPVAVASPER